MLAAYLPGNRTIELTEVPRPEPGHGQVRVAMRGSTICGSDLRAVYGSIWAKARRAAGT